ncbi:MAG: galactose-1-phosphate uridylyltransferase [Candidatus Diapherotrites archaeon]|nr:galactose-1-phosphate uridylyltransferase [Candidatus Diapherotrites archaeon]
MPELRKDYLRNRWVIIVPERSKRPRDFRQKPEKESPETRKKCPFCPGKEHLTPPEITRIEGRGKWEMRVFPNKFPAVNTEGDSEIKQSDSFFTYSYAYGYHEVVVESPKHGALMADFTPNRIRDALKLYNKRIKSLTTDPKIKHVSVFKNEGSASGASIAHTHTQIIAYSKLAETVDNEENVVMDWMKKHGKCPYCEIIAAEAKSPRAVMENKTAVAIAPYASRFPFEVKIFPKRHVNSITEFSNAELMDFAKILKRIFSKLKSLNASYNMYLHNASLGKELHCHIKINPRLVPWGGFEYATGCIINTVPPEKAAEFYRSKN